MSDAPLMLGVSGMRGIVGRSLTPQVAADFAGAFGRWLRSRGIKRARGAITGSADRPIVVVGADGRSGWETLHRAAVDALIESGCDVTDLGIAMTPTVAVVADHDGADGGLVITASHNPQQWNGLKCLVRSRAPREHADTCAPPPDLAAAIIEQFRSDRPEPPVRVASPPCFVEESGEHGAGKHIGAVLGAMGGGGPRPARPFRVVLDSVNGAGRFAGAELVRALGCELIHMGADDSGVFTHPPEPTKENLKDLCASVAQHGADIGFAQDPDADRLAIVDENGTYIGEEYTLALACACVLGTGGAEGEGEGGSGSRPTGRRVIVANLSTSRMIDDIAARHGATVVRTPVGEANVAAAMKREASEGKAAEAGTLIGGEGNGGVIWPAVTYVRDSLSAMALVLTLMARTGKTVSRLAADIPAYAIEKRKFQIPSREAAVPAVEKVAAHWKQHRIDRQDGIRVDFDKKLAWVHIRPSNTEPILRLIAEAPDAATASALLDEAEGLIKR